MSANRTRGWATRHRHPGANLRLSVSPARLTQAHALPPCREGFFHPARSHPAARSCPCTALRADSGGQATEGAPPTTQCSLDFWPTSFFPARSLRELTFQHCALLPRQSSAGPGPGPGGEPGRRGSVWAAESAGHAGCLRPARARARQVPGEVAVLSPHPRAPGGPDGRHVPPTGADNLLLPSAWRRRPLGGAGGGGGGSGPRQPAAAREAVHLDVLGQVVAAGELLLAHGALVGLHARVRTPVSRQLVRAREPAGQGGQRPRPHRPAEPVGSAGRAPSPSCPSPAAPPGRREGPVPVQWPEGSW